MKRVDLILTLLPEKADNGFRGKKLALVVFTGIAVLSSLRSLIHIFASDGTAGSITGLDLAVEGASAIIFAFALW